MIKKIHILGLALVTGLASLFITSCNSDSPGGLEEEPLYDFATLTGVNDNGSTLEVIRQGDEQPCTFTTPLKVDTTRIPVGDRLLITYVNSNGVSYVSGPINLYRYQQVLNGDIEIGTSTEWNSWRTNDVSIYYATRTGKYINVMANVYVLNAPKTFTIVADKETLNDEYPNVYLVFLSDTNLEGSMRSGYASWDISKVWDLPTCKGIKLHMANIVGDKVVTFAKDNPSIKPIE